MDSLIARGLLSRSPAERSVLIGRARNFVDNDQFINMLNLVDINDRKGDATRRLCRQLAVFSAIPGLEAKIRAWLQS